MNTSQETKPKNDRRKIWLIIIAIVVTIVVVIGIAWAAFQYRYRNLAQGVAGPLEKELVAMGGVKKCSTGDNGRGWDNLRPWYEAIYEIPGNRQEATERVRKATNKAGYSLKDGPYPGNPGDTKFYSDNTSKKIPYSQLKEGNVELFVDVYVSKAYDDQAHFCGVTKVANPPQDKTTIILTLNLTDFLRVNNR